MAEDTPSALAIENSIHLGPLDESAFQLRLGDGPFPVVGIVPDQIVTIHRTESSVGRENGHWKFDPQQDLALVASVERHRASGRIGLGLVAGFRLRRHGAMGSSVAHDSHNLVIAGTNHRDMLCCARALEESGGGFVVVADGAITASLPLPVAGLMSTEPADTVCSQLRSVREAARTLGCPLPAPFGTLSFLALPVIPEIRVTTGGLFDVTRQEKLGY